MAKLVNTSFSQMSNLTVGSSPDRGMRLNLPIAIVPLRRTDNWITIHRLYLGDEQDVVHPRPGSFRVIRTPTVTDRGGYIYNSSIGYIYVRYIYRA